MLSELYKHVFLKSISNPLKNQSAINRLVNWVGKQNIDYPSELSIEQHNLYSSQGRLSLFQSASFVYNYNQFHDNQVQLKIYSSYIKYLKPCDFPIYGVIVSK